jgi:hypothetical protein
MTPALKAIPEPAELTDADRKILAQADPSLARGLALYRWWQETDRTRAYRDSFPLQRKFNQAKRSIGFFDSAKLSSGEIPVLGVVQETTFDNSPLSPTGAREQMKNFVLRYLLRVADFERPSAFALRDLRQTDSSPEISGWGYSQCYYKLRDSGRVGKFPPGWQSRIVDLREIGDIYEWVVLQARLFNVEVDVSPFGDNAPHFDIPLAKFTEEYLIASPDFIVNEDDPSKGVLGRYGYGYATLHDPGNDKGPLLWGPGRFNPGFESFVFEVRETGETVVTSPFTVNRPDRIFGLSPDPVAMGVRFADLFSFGLASRLLPGMQHGFDPLLTPIAAINAGTGGLAGRVLGLSIDSVERFFLAQHFMAAYQLLTGAVQTYCQIPDWTAPEADLPGWVRDGRVVAPSEE